MRSTLTGDRSSTPAIRLPVTTTGARRLAVDESVRDVSGRCPMTALVSPTRRRHKYETSRRIKGCSHDDARSPARIPVGRAADSTPVPASPVRPSGRGPCAARTPRPTSGVKWRAQAMIHSTDGSIPPLRWVQRNVLCCAVAIRLGRLTADTAVRTFRPPAARSGHPLGDEARGFLQSRMSNGGML